uniref:lipoprotein n=1 Tax=Polynucleobacter sp. HIN7 TaxID=3047866 RepID=UPI00336532E3
MKGCSACYIQIPVIKQMTLIVVKIPVYVVLLSLLGCGVRGPLFLPNPPPAPPAPTQPEPKGTLYPPKESGLSTPTNTSSPK